MCTDAKNKEILDRKLSILKKEGAFEGDWGKKLKVLKTRGLVYFPEKAFVKV